MDATAHFRCDEDLRVRLYAFCRARKIMKRIECMDNGGKVVHIKIPHLSAGIRTILEEALEREGL